MVHTVAPSTGTILIEERRSGQTEILEEGLSGVCDVSTIMENVIGFF